MTNTCLGWLRPVLAFAALVTSSGCSDLNNCSEGSDLVIDVEGGTTYPDSLVYVSAPTDGPLPRFPAKRKLRFEHNLGVTPFLTQPSLSFAEHGTNGGSDGSIALPAGNSTLLDCVDSSVIVLRNDTCEEGFYVRVVAMAVPDGETDNDECSTE
ncbi:MAG TPA: hypothetical protein VHP33_41525 [Polyangiaceae bacterium]|nr:hypothetical protein [Polyangiaceae bacterium]